MTQQLDMTPEGVHKALNQLASVLAGKDLAIATNELADDPFARINAMALSASEDLVVAARAGDSKSLNQSQRKTQSLLSLATLAETISMGVDWDKVG